MNRQVADLRDHEKPHVVVIWDLRGASPVIPQYVRTHPDSAIWISTSYPLLADVMVFQIATHLPEQICLRLENLPPHDVHPDTKNRVSHSKQQKWVKATGDVFYAECRSIGNELVMTRVFNKLALSRIISLKLPVYAFRPSSLKGRFLYNLTQNIHRHISPDTVNVLQTIRIKDRQHKGKIPNSLILSILSHDTLDKLRSKNYIRTSQEYTSMTIRGKYLLFYYTMRLLKQR